MSSQNVETSSQRDRSSLHIKLLSEQEFDHLFRIMDEFDLLESSEPDDSEDEAIIDFRSTAYAARNYQLELFEHAKHKNSILVLGTGSGKTFIAILLIKHWGNQLSGCFPGEAKRSIMLANTVPLVRQQAKAIQQHVGYSVGAYDGSMGVDIWDKQKWNEEIGKNEVLVMVSQIFLDLLKANFISWDQVNLLIVDECHHATGNHPMREVMRHYYSVWHTLSDPPRVLGLTASIIQKKCKPFEVLKTFNDLEKAMGCHLLTTVHHEEVLKYTTKPKEVILHYNNERFSPSSEHSSLVIQNLQSMTEEVLANDEIDKKSQKALSRVLRNISSAISDLGEWCGSKAIKYEIENFVEWVIEEDIPILREMMNLILDRLRQIEQVCNAAEQNFVDLEKHVSHHVSLFLTFLVECCKNIDCHALVFVQTRATAFLLSELLNKLQSQGGVYEQITTRYVVGANMGGRSCSDIARASKSLVKQQETLNAFRVGKFKILVSTSVLEEGVDIRKCNFVVRFDEPMNFRAFVQSKGRARAVNSMYVLMVSPSSKLRNEMDEYHNLEASFKKVCRDRALPLPEEILESFSDDLLPPYMPQGLNGPRITSASSLTVIYQYCDKLPHDHFTSLAPEISVKEIVDNDSLSYVASLKLPLSSPCNSVYVGQPMQSRDWAKKAVALKVCVALHEAGELNESLMPFRKILIDEELFKPIIGDVDDDDDKTEVPGKVGSMKRRQVYERAVCQSLSTKIKSECHLYRLRLKHVVRVENCENFDGSHNFGLLCAHRLVPCTFPLYNNKWGQMDLTLEYVRSCAPSPLELKSIVAFNEFLFDFLLNVNNEVMEFSHDSKWQCLVVPLFANSVLDVELIDAVAKIGKMNLAEPLERARKEFSFNAEMYKDAIVVPWYKEREVYCVYKVTNETILSDAVLLGSKTQNHKDYFLERYNLTIFCESQLLLECRHVPSEMNCLAPVDAKLKKRNSLHPRLVPELVHLLPIPAHLYFQASLLPSILQRLNGLHLASDFITKINQLPQNSMHNSDISMTHVERVIAVNPPPLESLQYDWCEKVTRDIVESHPSRNLCIALSVREGIRFDDFNSFVASGFHSPESMKMEVLRLLQALTPLKSLDCFNFERLEVLGDSFLKFHLGQMLFLQYPEWHEGKLTAHRGQFVSNNVLYKLGKKIDLPSFLQGTRLTPLESGPAPGFVVRPAMRTELLQKSVPHQQWHCYHADSKAAHSDDEMQTKDSQKKKAVRGCFDPWTHQSVPDKMVADSIEALLGSWLLTCGLCGVHQLLLLLGFPIGEAVQVPRTAVLENRSDFDRDASDAEVERLYKQHVLNRLEDILGYTFRNKSFLLQAVTHPTFTANKVTHYYQRLEFLGDAVLDFLVTSHVFASPKLSPGRITDIRTHYVRNDTLALACVNANMHRFFQHHCMTLQGMIDSYVTLIKGEETDESVDSVSYDSSSDAGISSFDEEMFNLDSNAMNGVSEVDAPSSELNMESDVMTADKVEVPKVLGDLVEAVIGAVYLDSNLSLDVCWKVVRRLIPDLERGSFERAGIDCVRLMHENAVIENIEKIKPEGNNGVAKFRVKVKGLDWLTGCGKNLRCAKQAVAKLVLQRMYGNKWYCAGKSTV
ncbi:Helicase C-terminal [Trinorchestia longiramus]|nr:Helicase C-terminal [Trinorchestia longiramus]